MRIKPKTVEKFINELSNSFVGKLFEENGEPDTILLMQKYLDEGRGSTLEQILMGRAIAELVNLREEMANLTNRSTCSKEAYGTISIENINKICREDERTQLTEMLNLQEEAKKRKDEK